MVLSLSTIFCCASSNQLNRVAFTVEGPEDAQVTLGMEEDTVYKVTINGVDSGCVKTNMSGKLVLSVEMGNEDQVMVKAEKQ